MRSMAIFDLGRKGYDVWNALIVAIVVCHVRNEMVRLVQAGAVLFDSARDVEDDPDA